MIKYAQFSALWPQIYQKLKSPPPGVNLGAFSGKLPPMDKIKIDPGRLSEESRAIGYVSTEDVDNNGSLDVIHIASPRLEEALREANVPLDGLQNINKLTNEQLVSLLMPFVELLSHEMGHLEDYSPEGESPFPGGESTAESAAHSALQQVSVATTNISNEFDKVGKKQMKAVFSDNIKSLSGLAKQMHEYGNTKMAEKINKMLRKYSEDFIGRSEESPLTNPNLYAEKGKLEFPLSEERMAPVGTPGQIRPKGDSFTYNYNAEDKTFIVASAPRGSQAALHYVFNPGSDGYDILKAEAIRIGLLPEEKTPKERAPEARKVEYPLLEKAQDLAEQLNLNLFTPMGRLTSKEAWGIVESKQRAFRNEMSNLAEELSDSAGMLGGGAAGGALRAVSQKLKDPDLDGSSAIQTFNRDINPLLPVVVGSKAPKLQASFRNKLRIWDDVVTATELAKILEKEDAVQSLERGGQAAMSEQNLSDDGFSSEVKLSEDMNEMKKVATLKQEYRKIFWHKPERPFNR